MFQGVLRGGKVSAGRGKVRGTQKEAPCESQPVRCPSASQGDVILSFVLSEAAPDLPPSPCPVAPLPRCPLSPSFSPLSFISPPLQVHLLVTSPSPYHCHTNYYSPSPSPLLHPKPHFWSATPSLHPLTPYHTLQPLPSYSSPLLFLYSINLLL